MKLSRKSVCILVASGAFLVVLAAAIRCVGRSKEAPVPQDRGAGLVRVVATGRDNRQRPNLRPLDTASSPVNTICGLDGETAGRFPVRIRALRSIARCRNLPPEDVSVLLGYVASTNDVMSADRVAALKNDVLNLLRNQDTAPAQLPRLLIDMLENGEYDATMTDYCIQHLGSMWSAFRSEGMSECVRAVLADAASCKEFPYSGTALYALADDIEAPDEARERLRRLTVSLACDPAANPLARISAIQLSAQRRFLEVMPTVRRLLAEPHPDMLLAMVSVGAIGCLGRQSDIHLLEDVRDRCGERIRPAVDAALSKLSRSSK